MKWWVSESKEGENNERKKEGINKGEKKYKEVKWNNERKKERKNTTVEGWGKINRKQREKHEEEYV